MALKFSSFITQYKDGEVQVSPGVTYSITEIIEQAHRNYNSKYVVPNDASGLERIFYNITWVVYRTIIMGSNVDLKDINFRSINGAKLLILNLLKMAVRSHLLRTYFGSYIDKVMGEFVWFGTSITKRVDGSVYTVDLRNIIRPPHIKDIQESGLAERMRWTYEKMQSKKEDWKEHWDDIEHIWEGLQKENKNRFTLYEWWTFNDKGEKVCKVMLEKSTEDEKNAKPEWEPYLELEEYKTPGKVRRASKRMAKKMGEFETLFPYEQIGLFDVPGRWLDFGCSEILQGLQEHYNEKFNLYRKKDILDLRGILVHKYTANSNSLTQEFLANQETGDVISMDVGEDLQRLVIDTKTAEFIASVDKLYELSRLMMGVTSQGTGEDQAATQTATMAVANQRTQQTTYDFVREKMHHFIQRLFANGFLEDIIDEMSQKEYKAIVGDSRDLEEMDSQLLDSAVDSHIKEMQLDPAGMAGLADAVTKMMGQAQINQMQDPMAPGMTYEQACEAVFKQMKDKGMADLRKQGDMRFPELKKEMLKDLDYYIEFYVTNETFDKGQKVQNLMAMKADPTFTGSRKALEEEILYLLDENPAAFRKTEEEKAAEMEQQRNQAMEAQGLMQPANPMKPANQQR
jgi:hypothetical protein